MIQRIQSLWLLLAAIAAFLSLTLPFYNIVSIVQPDALTSGGAPNDDYTGASNVPILLLTIITGLLSFVTIFLYKNRSLQLKLTVGSLILVVGIIALYFLEMRKDSNARISLFCIVTIVIPALLFLAARGIYNDNKLVKSADRLRP